MRSIYNFFFLISFCKNQIVCVFSVVKKHHGILQIGTLMKHNKERQWSVIKKINLPLSVQDKFYLEYDDLKHIMDVTLSLTLPSETSETEYIYANGFDDTRIRDVFWKDECTRKNCVWCDKRYKHNYSFLQYQGKYKINKNPTRMQLEALLFIIDMHSNIVDMCETFSESVIRKCETEGKELNKTKIKAVISKERKLQQTMLKSLKYYNAKVFWAKVRRCVRMRHNARKLLEYKYQDALARRKLLRQWESPGYSGI